MMLYTRLERLSRKESDFFSICLDETDGKIHPAAFKTSIENGLIEYMKLDKSNPPFYQKPKKFCALDPKISHCGNICQQKTTNNLWVESGDAKEQFIFVVCREKKKVVHKIKIYDASNPFDFEMHEVLKVQNPPTIKIITRALLPLIDSSVCVFFRGEGVIKFDPSGRFLQRTTPNSALFKFSNSPVTMFGGIMPTPVRDSIAFANITQKRIEIIDKTLKDNIGTLIEYKSHEDGIVRGVKEDSLGFIHVFRSDNQTMMIDTFDSRKMGMAVKSFLTEFKEHVRSEVVTLPSHEPGGGVNFFSSHMNVAHSVNYRLSNKKKVPYSSFNLDFRNR